MTLNNLQGILHYEGCDLSHDLKAAVCRSVPL